MDRKASSKETDGRADEQQPTQPTRRLALFRTLWSVFVIIVCALSILRGTIFGTAYIKPSPKPKAAPLIDGHIDLLFLIRLVTGGNHIYGDSFITHFEEGGLVGHVDLPRIDAGHLGGAFWSAFVPCPADGMDFSDETYAPFVRATLEQIDTFNRLALKYPKYFTLPRNASEAEYNYYEKGQLISPLAIEGLHQIGNSLSTLRLFHSLGARYVTLTWNCHNAYADAAVIMEGGKSVAAKPYWGGVSPAGRELVREMNRMGMIVDLSHVSEGTMRDVLGGGKGGWDGSLAPPIFSHSSAYALCPHPRNVPDDVLQLVKARNSLVMVNFSPAFVSCRARADSPNGLPEFRDETNTIEHVADHIMYIGRAIGFEHVGIGSDYDGILTTPRGLEDVSKYPDLLQILRDRGVSGRDVENIAGLNLLRVWHEVDRVAARLQKELNPAEDDLGHGDLALGLKNHDHFKDYLVR